MQKKIAKQCEEKFAIRWITSVYNFECVWYVYAVRTTYSTMESRISVENCFELIAAIHERINFNLILIGGQYMVLTIGFIGVACFNYHSIENFKLKWHQEKKNKQQSSMFVRPSEWEFHIFTEFLRYFFYDGRHSTKWFRMYMVNSCITVIKPNQIIII